MEGGAGAGDSEEIELLELHASVFDALGYFGMGSLFFALREPAGEEGERTRRRRIWIRREARELAEQRLGAHGELDGIEIGEDGREAWIRLGSDRLWDPGASRERMLELRAGLEAFARSRGLEGAQASVVGWGSALPEFPLRTREEEAALRARAKAGLLAWEEAGLLREAAGEGAAAPRRRGV